MEFLASDQGRLVLFGVAAAMAVAAFFVFRRNRSTPGRTIRVVGIGGAGANAIDAMRRAGLQGVDFVAVNTDFRALNRSSAATKVAIGRSTTQGLGAGGEVAVGESAAREAAEAIGRAIDGSDLVVMVAGLGGGTGSGAAPIVAEIARGQGALTVAVVTKPFAFEGFRKARLAQDAEAALVGLVDAVATIPNDQVRTTSSAEVTVEEAFQAIDDSLHRNVAEIIALVAVPGRINLDVADVRAVLRGGGAAAMGFGRAAGEHRASDATREAIAATLLEDRIRGAGSVLVNVSASRKLRLAELDAVAQTITEATGRDTNLVFGVNLAPQLRDELQVTIIATGAPVVATGVAPVAAAEVGSAVAEPTESTPAASSEPDAEIAAATEVTTTEPADSEDWRPVWLRRTTPASTPAPERSMSPSQARTSSRRARKRRHQTDAQGAPQPDDGPSS